MCGFDTAFGVPHNDVNLKSLTATSVGWTPGDASVLSEAASLSLEYSHVAQVRLLCAIRHHFESFDMFLAVARSAIAQLCIVRHWWLRLLLRHLCWLPPSSMSK